jgi:hypothetical protein
LYVSSGGKVFQAEAIESAKVLSVPISLNEEKTERIYVNSGN